MTDKVPIIPLRTESGELKGRRLRDGRVLSNLTSIERNRINAWAWVADYSEAKWLEANGWKQMADGRWSLPYWHPRIHQPIMPAYNQAHANNSQRFYMYTVRPPKLPAKVVLIPTYVRLQPHLLLLVTSANMLGVSGVVLYERWYSWLLIVAAIIFICASCYVIYAIRKGSKLDYAEERLGGRHGTHDPN